jgi:hypothetical protein
MMLGAELQGGVLIDKLCGGEHDITLEGKRSNLRRGTYGAWSRSAGKAVLLVVKCMSEGGVNIVEFSSLKCKIKRSNRCVVQGGGCLDRQQWAMCVVSKKSPSRYCSSSLNWQ